MRKKNTEPYLLIDGANATSAKGHIINTCENINEDPKKNSLTLEESLNAITLRAKFDKKSIPPIFKLPPILTVKTFHIIYVESINEYHIVCHPCPKAISSSRFNFNHCRSRTLFRSFTYHKKPVRYVTDCGIDLPDEIVFTYKMLHL